MSVDGPTHVIQNNTLMDHTNSNFSNNIQFIDVSKIVISDRYPVFLSRKVNINLPKQSQHTIK